MASAQETVLEINLKHLKNNYQYLRSKIESSTKFMAIVKAYAYGNDACEIAKYLDKLGVDYFGVAYAEEGVALREAGIQKPILVLHPQIANLKRIVSYNLEPSLYNARILKAFVSLCNANNLSLYPVHIKFNTGLNRLGFWENDIEYISEQLNDENSIKVVSLFSHLAASEDLSEAQFAKSQISSFNKICEEFLQRFGFLPIRHICNTSGILNYSEAQYGMVRSGIGLYGFGNSTTENKNLKPIAALKSVISQIHAIEKGESVGYNRAYVSSAFEKTATIPIGHADGIGRHYGNGKGYVVIGGKKAPIIGNVCMDMMMVNISNIDCNEGDEVVVFGGDHTAENLAETVNSISYEMITGISQRVKRIVIK